MTTVALQVLRVSFSSEDLLRPPRVTVRLLFQLLTRTSRTMSLPKEFTPVMTLSEPQLVRVSRVFREVCWMSSRQPSETCRFPLGAQDHATLPSGRQARSE